MTDADANALHPAGLLDRAIDGSDAVFAQIYRDHASALYALALRMTGNRATAEDVVQDCFLRALRSGRHFRGDAAPRTWLTRIVINLAIDRIRQHRQWLIEPDAIETLAASPSTDHDTAAALGLLAGLSPAARSVVWLHEMEGHSHAEIATLFGASESWSKSILSRSLKRLRASLEQTR